MTTDTAARAAQKTLWDKVGLLRKGRYMPEPE